MIYILKKKKEQIHPHNNSNTYDINSNLIFIYYHRAQSYNCCDIYTLLRWLLYNRYLK